MSVIHSPSTPLRDPTLARLFPLPLTVMESFMVTDSTADYPMMADHQVQFSGRIDRKAFDSGLAFAIERNPLPTSLVTRDRRRGWCWTLTERVPEVNWAPLGTPIDEHYGAPVDLTRDIGLRIWVREGQDRSTVLFHLHHACCDGIGGFALIEDLMAGYANACPAAAAVQPRTLEPERLAKRGEAGMVKRPLLRQIADIFVGMREGAKFFLQSPRPLEQASGEDAIPDVSPSSREMISHTLSQQATSGLRQLATQSGATVNDVLLRDLFLTLRRWNVEHGNMRGRENLRILMPQNLRDRDDCGLPAANVMSFAFLTRRADRCDKPDALLQSIHEETSAIRRGRLSLYFLGSLASLQAAGLLPWLLRREMSFSTVVLTNLGDSTRRFSTRFPRTANGLVVGNLIYEGVDAVPPLRPLTRAAFAIRNNPRTLTISLKTDARLFSATDTKQLLAKYAEQLLATAKISPIVDAGDAACDTTDTIAAELLDSRNCR